MCNCIRSRSYNFRTNRHEHELEHEHEQKCIFMVRVKNCFEIFLQYKHQFCTIRYVRMQRNSRTKNWKCMPSQIIMNDVLACGVSLEKFCLLHYWSNLNLRNVMSIPIFREYCSPETKIR